MKQNRILHCRNCQIIIVAHTVEAIKYAKTEAIVAEQIEHKNSDAMPVKRTTQFAQTLYFAIQKRT